jgi:hypothetical protein
VIPEFFQAKPSANACSIHDRHSWQQHVNPDENEDETQFRDRYASFLAVGRKAVDYGIAASLISRTAWVPLECRFENEADRRSNPFCGINLRCLDKIQGN